MSGEWKVTSKGKEGIFPLPNTKLGRLIERYFNNVTGEWQEESPPIFRGGLLADAMGL